jgi:hypothetical protein
MVARLLLLAAALLAAAPAAAQSDINCPKPPGYLGGPLIDEDIARKIFVAVTDPFAGGEDFSSFEIIVKETADRRALDVFHVSPAGRRGGGMSMRIDRCTGAISRLHYRR